MRVILVVVAALVVFAGPAVAEEPDVCPTTTTHFEPPEGTIPPPVIERGDKPDRTTSTVRFEPPEGTIQPEPTTTLEPTPRPRPVPPPTSTTLADTGLSPFLLGIGIGAVAVGAVLRRHGPRR